jgi:XrtJ-associated TM-motif-TM protein
LLPDERAARRLKEKATMRRGLFLLALMAAAAALPLWAQGGCVDSPEDPTIVLALLGGFGAAAAMSWKTFRSRKNQ